MVLLKCIDNEGEWTLRIWAKKTILQTRLSSLIASFSTDTPCPQAILCPPIRKEVFYIVGADTSRLSVQGNTKCSMEQSFASFHCCAFNHQVYIIEQHKLQSVDDGTKMESCTHPRINVFDCFERVSSTAWVIQWNTQRMYKQTDHFSSSNSFFAKSSILFT